MNSVIEYLLNNTVRVCIVAPSFQQTNLIRDDILNKIYRNNNNNQIYTVNSSIDFLNGSRIDFICSTSYNGVQKIRGIRYDLMLFKDSYYNNDMLTYNSTVQKGIYVC